MPASDFANLIISNLKGSVGVDGSKYDSSTPTSAQSVIASAINSYIESNTTVTTLFEGTNTSTGAYVSGSDAFTVTAAISMSAPASFDAWLAQLSLQLSLKVKLNSRSNNKNTATPIPVITSSINLSQSVLKEAYESTVLDGTALKDNPGDVQTEVWKVVCQAIMDAINDSAGATTVGGYLMGAATGTHTVLKINIT